MDEERVNVGTVGQFGMETGRPHVTLPNKNGMPVVGSERFHFRRGTFYTWRADKDGRHLVGNAFYVYVCYETVDLRTVSVASDVDVHRADPQLVAVFNFFGQQNHAGAGTENR